MPDEKTVVVTGFGPFQGHGTNASWVAAQELAKLELPDGISLVTMEIPVEYRAVEKMVPVIWGKYKPDLVVHLGVSGIASALTLEQQSHNNGYERLDVCQTKPEPPWKTEVRLVLYLDGRSLMICKLDGPECIQSGIDMTSVCKDVNASECNVKAVVSHCAGRYLCEYVYYASLHQDQSCAAFIHVPPLNKPYTAHQLALGVREAVLSMLRHIAPSADS